MTRILCLAAVAALSLVSVQGAAGEEPAADQQALHKKFEQALTGATLKGQFTVIGKPAAPREESYVIRKVTWLDLDDLWKFDVQMKYGNVDKTMTLALPVKWVGDTPLIVLNETAIPTLGTFSAHVVIDGDRYAGTWTHHGAGGGHMFGVIERGDAEKK